jgi:hypothetical protein
MAESGKFGNTEMLDEMPIAVQALGAPSTQIDTAWPDAELSAVVVTRYNHAVPVGQISSLRRRFPAMSLASKRRCLSVICRHEVGLVERLTQPDGNCGDSQL